MLLFRNPVPWLVNVFFDQDNTTVQFQFTLCLLNFCHIRIYYHQVKSLKINRSFLVYGISPKHLFENEYRFVNNVRVKDKYDYYSQVMSNKNLYFMA